jgi:hypothetical protein
MHPCHIRRCLCLRRADVDEIVLPPKEFRRTVYLDSDITWFPSVFVDFHRDGVSHFGSQPLLHCTSELFVREGHSTDETERRHDLSLPLYLRRLSMHADQIISISNLAGNERVAVCTRGKMFRASVSCIKF